MILYTFILNGTLCFNHRASEIAKVVNFLTAEGDSDLLYKYVTVKATLIFYENKELNKIINELLLHLAYVALIQDKYKI